MTLYRGNAQVLIFCWLLVLLVKLVLAATFEVFITNFFEILSKSSFYNYFRHHQINKFYCAIRMSKINIHIIFKEKHAPNKWGFPARKVKFAMMIPKLC